MDYFNRYVERRYSIGLIAVLTMFCTNVIAQMVLVLYGKDLIAVLQKRLLVGEAKFVYKSVS